MSKTKDETPILAFEVGKPIKVEAATREEVAEKLKALRNDAEGLNAQGGFIEYDGGEKFSAVIKFVK